MIDKEIIAVFHYDDKGSKCCGREPYRYAEEIIRCKQCKHGTYCEEADMYICNANDQDLYEAEHFCSYGEREGE